MDKIAEDLLKVLELAKQISSTDVTADPESALPLYEEYLQSLETWQVNYQSELDNMRESLSEDDPRRVQLREMMKELTSLHEKITSEAVDGMNQVGSQIASVNKRAQAMKKYVDTLPHRVSTIKGKKG